MQLISHLHNPSRSDKQNMRTRHASDPDVRRPQHVRLPFDLAICLCILLDRILLEGCVESSKRQPFCASRMNVEPHFRARTNEPAQVITCFHVGVLGAQYDTDPQVIDTIRSVFVECLA